MLDQVNFFLDPDKDDESMLGRVSFQGTLSFSRDLKYTLDQQNVFRGVNNRFAKVHSLWLFYIFYQKYILCIRNCVSLVETVCHIRTKKQIFLDIE